MCRCSDQARENVLWHTGHTLPAEAVAEEAKATAEEATAAVACSPAGVIVLLVDAADVAWLIACICNVSWC